MRTTAAMLAPAPGGPGGPDHGSDAPASSDPEVPDGEVYGSDAPAPGGPEGPDGEDHGSDAPAPQQQHSHFWLTCGGTPILFQAVKLAYMQKGFYPFIIFRFSKNNYLTQHCIGCGLLVLYMLSTGWNMTMYMNQK